MLKSLSVLPVIVVIVIVLMVVVRKPGANLSKLPIKSIRNPVRESSRMPPGKPLFDCVKNRK